MGFFSPKLKIFELKIYRWVLFHDNEEWCKNWYEEFDEFWSEHSKISKICALLSCLWPKHIMFKLKKYRGVMFDGTEDWCKIWWKTDSGFNTSNLENFHQSTWKSQNWDLDGIFSSKVRKCTSLQCTGELFVLSKMTWRICQIFFHRLKNSNFILERKMAELNQNKNRPDRPDAVWELYFALEINET